MKSEHLFPHEPHKREPEFEAPGSRLLDEKISDESSFEGKADDAFAPAGLNNPFWN